MNIKLLALSAVMAACVVSEASAQGAQCSSHEDMEKMLAENWGESRQAVMLDAADSMVELFASEETGTWTMTVTKPGQPTCMIASGYAYEPLQEKLIPGDDA